MLSTSIMPSARIIDLYVTDSWNMCTKLAQSSAATLLFFPLRQCQGGESLLSQRTLGYLMGRALPVLEAPIVLVRPYIVTHFTYWYPGYSVLLSTRSLQGLVYYKKLMLGTSLNMQVLGSHPSLRTGRSLPLAGTEQRQGKS